MAATRCAIEGCDKQLTGRRVCSMHYHRIRKHGDPHYVAPRINYGECSVDGCDVMARTRGYCPAHYQRWLATGDPQADKPRRRKKNTEPPPCSVDGCERKAISRGWCSTHYSRWRKHGDPLPPSHKPVIGKCSVDGCERQWRSGRMCHKHYRRWQKYGDPLHEWKPERKSTWRRDSAGYVVRYWPEHPNASKQGYVLQHTVVMAEALGRPVRRGETVHHRNGIRHDNRPENLELWAKSHPPGQRVSELIAWAHELLEQYRDDPQLWPEGLQP